MPKAIATKINNRDLPTVENEPSLEDWLSCQGARMLWQHDGPVNSQGLPAYRVAAYQIRTRTAIVVIRPKQAGWDIFTAGNSTDIDRTLDDAERRLGL